MHAGWRVDPVPAADQGAVPTTLGQLRRMCAWPAAITARSVWV